MKAPRPYQLAALEATRRQLQQFDSTVVVLPTGLGKTVYAAKLIAEWDRGNTLFLAHTKELIAQAADKLGAELGYRPGVEMGAQSVEMDTLWSGGLSIVGSVQTMYGDRRLEKYRRHPFGLIVIDECHHSTAATYRKVVDFFRELNPSLKVVGITATPNRSDGTALGLMFESVAYQMSINDAVAEGWLVPVAQEFVVVDQLELDAVKTKKNEFGEADFSQAQLEEVMVQEEMLHKLAVPTLAKVGDRPTLVFTASVRHAHELAAVLNRYKPDSAVAVDGSTDPERRKEIVRDFSAGRVQFLANCAVLTEGFDAPNCAAVVMGRPTKSLTLYCLSEDTEVLTDRGWENWKTLCCDPQSVKAAGYDLVTGVVRWTDISGVYRRPLGEGERMFSLESHQTAVRVTESHRMLFRPVGSTAPFSLIPAAELAARGAEYEIPVAGLQDAPGVPLTDSELEFIGWLMTDGSVNKTTLQAIIRQSASQPWIGRLEETIRNCGFKYTRRDYVRQTQFSDHAPTVEFTISAGKPRGRDKHLAGWGRLAPYFDKNFSVLLEDVTADQLAVLLEAMHLGDGTKFANEPWTRQSYHIATARKRLADRLQSLCVRRGFRCSLAEKKYNARPLYMLHIKRAQTRHVGGAGYTDRPVLRECERTAGETVWCVTTGTSTIVTRRNGKVVLMGQTQMLGRGLRPLPGTVDGVPDAQERRLSILTSDKPQCLVLDFVGNSKHKLASAYDVLGGNYDCETRELARREATRERKDVGEVMEQAAALLTLERKWKEREHIRARDVVWGAHAVDPFDADAAELVGSDYTGPARGTATDSQVRLLVNLGVSERAAFSYSKRQASAVIDDLGGKRCTTKQAATLRKHGVDPDGVNMDRASRIIDAIAANGWRRPEELPD